MDTRRTEHLSLRGSANNAMNVALLVLDCFRADALTERAAPNLHKLASENLSFERCVTPANWSLPAHASLFTGKWPHEHNFYHREHYVNELPLIDTFNARGYRTVGVSANIYASTSHGFGNGFDQFYETRRRLNPRGLNPFANVRKIQEEREPGPKDYLQTFVDAVRHDHPIASLNNYTRAAFTKLDRRYLFRRRLPLVNDNQYGFLTEASNRTSDMLLEAFDRTKRTNPPLFAFANYMDTHYPYQPSREHFEAVAGEDEQFEDIQNINPNIASSKTFLNEYFGDRIDEEDITLIRTAYRGEVRSIDEQIGQLLDELNSRGILEETLVIVTADHGECLGEADLRGERGMGHLDSLNKHLWRVPLIISNPDIDAITVEDRVSLQSLFYLLTSDLAEFVESGGQTYSKFFNKSPIFFELPANPFHESSFKKLEDIPERYVEREAKTHTIVGLDKEWCIAIDSRGKAFTWEDGTPVAEAEVPDRLLTECHTAMTQFADIHSDVESELSDDVAQQLEKLGYI